MHCRSMPDTGCHIKSLLPQIPPNDPNKSCNEANDTKCHTSHDGRFHSMQPQSQSPLEATQLGAAAIRHLAAHGYSATTAGELADAMGISRSTFFRRFGSKDDVIFVDHDLALARLSQELDSSEAPVHHTIARATVGVLNLLTQDPAAAQLRSELLRRTAALRDRELVITHRYERVFADYLARVAAPGAPDWAPHALAAGIVAVHNATLRRWLRDPDPRVVLSLDTELRQLVQRFAPWFGEVTASRAPLVVAAFPGNATPEEILAAIQTAIKPEIS